MNRQELAEQLDQQLESLCRDLTRDDPADPLLAIAAELRHIPTAAFRQQLLNDLMANAESSLAGQGETGWAGFRASGLERSLDPWVGSTAFAETLTMFSGKSSRLFPVDHRSFVFSFLSHTVLILLIASTIVIGTHPTPTIDAVSRVTYFSLAHGGGGSGQHQAISASRGTPPPFSSQQLSSPILVETHAPRLPVAPTVLGPPEITPPQSNQLGDLMAPADSLPSNGTGSGGAMGNASGTGLGSGLGGGVGPGGERGFGGGPFARGEVIAPREIYNPDPEYSEEGRKAKQQGTVVLSLVVDAEGRPRDIHVVRSLGMGLDEKAIEALRKWKFEPGRKAGIPVAMQVNVEVAFRLY